MGTDECGAAPPPRRAGHAWADQEWDLVVAGGGNAAVVAAIAAEEAGCRVLVLERAPVHLRGGNSRHTRNIRCVHEADSYNSGAYRYDELWQDLCNVGEGPNNEELASFTVRDSETLPGWMHDHGARWQQPLHGTLHLGRTNRFFLAGGKALLNSYYRYVATRPRITVAYDAKVDELELQGARCTAVVVAVGGTRHRVRTRSLICASGGFEANLDWLRRYWGDAVDNYIVRGTPYNDGHVLARLFDAGAARAGAERGFHAIALDARAPKFDGGIATRLDTIPFGIVVNHEGRRFYDEGEDFWPKRYAVWGGHIARQDQQIAYSLWDAKASRLTLPPMYGATSGSTIEEVTRALGLRDDAVARTGQTVAEYNAGVVDGTFDPAALDDCRTDGVTPAKSHWAQRLDTPPFYGIAMRPGITFTYLGVAVDASARVVLEDGTALENTFAAGEIMSGNILSTGYLAGFGMTIGSVWGRRAGTKAAAHVFG
ncbi:MAG TPA: FAD-dependent tricarballylate dehydrogenase TcuA [Trebonia sp.]